MIGSSARACNRKTRRGQFTAEIAVRQAHGPEPSRRAEDAEKDTHSGHEEHEGHEDDSRARGAGVRLVAHGVSRGEQVANVCPAPAGRKIYPFFRPFHGLDASCAGLPQLTLWPTHLTPRPGLEKDRKAPQENPLRELRALRGQMISSERGVCGQVRLATSCTSGTVR